MKIYTRTGDEGKTSLFGGVRVDKNNSRIEAYGTLDELNSLIGIVLSETLNTKSREFLNNIQQDLFMIGAELATPNSVKGSKVDTISSKDVKILEDYIDEFDNYLSPLKNFILPSGKKSAAILHLARTVCRRAERRIVEINIDESVNPQIITYINRLSDFLFVVARYENHLSSISESEWRPRG